MSMATYLEKLIYETGLYKNRLFTLIVNKMHETNHKPQLGFNPILTHKSSSKKSSIYITPYLNNLDGINTVVPHDCALLIWYGLYLSSFVS